MCVNAPQCTLGIYNKKKSGSIYVVCHYQNIFFQCSCFYSPSCPSSCPPVYAIIYTFNLKTFYQRSCLFTPFSPSVCSVSNCDINICSKTLILVNYRLNVIQEYPNYMEPLNIIRLYVIYPHISIDCTTVVLSIITIILKHFFLSADISGACSMFVICRQIDFTFFRFFSIKFYFFRFSKFFL